MLAVVPVQRAVLDGALETAGDKLIDLYVRSRGVVLACCGRLVKVLGYRCSAEGFSCQPADAL